MPDQPIHSVSVAGVVLDEAGRVLVTQRRDNGRWEAPGGVLEREELPHGPGGAAVRAGREVRGPDATGGHHGGVALGAGHRAGRVLQQRLVYP